MSHFAHRVRVIVRTIAVSAGIGAMLGPFGASQATAASAPCGPSRPNPVPTSTWKFAPRPNPTPQPKLAKNLHAGCAPMMKSVRSVKPSGVGVPPPPGTVNGHG